MDSKSAQQNPENLSDIPSQIALANTTVSYFQHEALRIKFDLQSAYLDLSLRRYKKIREECVLHLNRYNDVTNAISRVRAECKRSLEVEREALIMECEWFRLAAIGLTIASVTGWIGFLGSVFFRFS